MSDYDVIIIGAGSVGTPTAYFLAKEGEKVLVIDRHSSSGQGQNKSAIGGTRATHSDPAKIKICKQALEVFSGWQEETGDYIGWKKGGYSFPVYRENEEGILKGILPIQKEHGLNIDWHDAERIKEIIPGVNPEGLIGGTFSPDDGQVSPLLATESFAKQAIKLGATFNFGEEVTKLETGDNRVTAVKTDKGSYTSEQVLIAAGGRATQVCKMAGLDIPVNPDSHEAGISAPVKHFLDPLIVDLRPGADGKTANFYFGQNSEGRIIFCYTPKDIFPGENREPLSEFMPVIARRLVDLIPRFKNLLIRRVWRGLYPMTPDGIPVMDKAPGYENLHLGVGMCGQGFMMGPGIAKNLTNMMLKGEPRIEKEVAESLRADRNFYAAKKEALK
jgi:sarcosine oxidase subunit beta